jgi:hypothetical protein
LVRESGSTFVPQMESLRRSDVLGTSPFKPMLK